MLSCLADICNDQITGTSAIPQATSVPRASAVSANPSAGSGTSAGTAQLLQSSEESPASQSARRPETEQTASSAAVTALELAVDRLTRHLTSVCAEGAHVDVAQIAWSSEALARACKALEDVKDLYH